MAINKFCDNTDINIYFHMKNHYRRLRSAKSTIDNSFPQSYIQSFPTPPGSARSVKNNNSKGRHLKNHSQTTIRSNIKKHKCVAPGSENSETSLNAINILPRPKTIKKMQNVTRSECLDSTNSVKDLQPTFSKTKNKRKLSRNITNFEPAIKIENGPIDHQQLKNEETDKSDTDPSLLPRETEEKIKQSRVQEHEYLQFLLRITEDIIINNLYTNEDIEKVFQMHIDTNKDHLNVEKMEAQLVRLCMELGIPYKTQENNDIDLNCYEYFFNQNTYDSEQNLENCECTTKRTLNIEVKSVNNEKNEQNNESYLHKMFNVLASRYSDSKILNSRAPCSSLTTMIESIKQVLPSSISNTEDSEDVDIVKTMENLNLLDEFSKLSSNDITVDTKRESLCSDSSLTPKEKLVCIEEDILFNKYDCNLAEEVESDYINEFQNYQNITNIIDSQNKFNPDGVQYQIIPEETLSCHKLENIENTFSDDSLMSYENHINCAKNQNNVPVKVMNELLIADNITEVATVDQSVQIVSDFMTNDQSVQIEVKQSDKECNTSIPHDYSQDEYILLNGPIYVLKTILNSEDKLIIYDKENLKNNTLGNEMRPEKLCEDYTQSMQHGGSVPIYQVQQKLDLYSEDDFSKLLNSDYDLMPQRDSDTSSNKYHHLLVDASTSISNVNLNRGINNTLTNADALLLTDNYEFNQLDDQNNLPKMDTEAELSLLERNEINVENKLSIEGHYECCQSENLTSVHSNSDYSIMKETVQFHEKIRSFSNTFTTELISQNIARGTVHINKDASESGEIVGAGICTDDEDSTYISDNERKSSISSSTTSHILGKRKLRCPS